MLDSLIHFFLLALVFFILFHFCQLFLVFYFFRSVRKEEDGDEGEASGGDEEGGWPRPV